MRYLSIFSGIEAASAAWEPLGWKAVAFAEIDDFASAVLRHHYPDIPNLGDVKQIVKERFNEQFDLLVGGSPCQNFSIGSNRQGLNGKDSVLAYEYLRITAEYRPCWIIWENVPGALSANQGADFACILQAFSNSGYSVAWRVLDAKFFGVPQARRRVFIVGHLGNDWRPPAAVLFDSENGSRDLEKMHTARRQDQSADEAAPIAYSWHGQSGDMRPLKDCCCTVSRKWGEGGHNVPLTFAKRTHSDYQQSELAGTLMARHLNEHFFVDSEFGLRSLTPLEAERLQGFPDNWTLIDYHGRPACKTPRYKAVGNSMAVPVMRWLGERIAAVEELMQEIREFKRNKHH